MSDTQQKTGFFASIGDFLAALLDEQAIIDETETKSSQGFDGALKESEFLPTEVGMVDGQDFF